MRQFHDLDRKTPLETARGSLLMLAFGLGMLAFLVAIDRPEWFNLRPASGTAAAMSNAAKTVAAKEEARKERAEQETDLSAIPQ